MYKNGQFVKERLQTIKTKRVISPLTSRVILGGIRDGSQFSQASFPCFHEEALSFSPPGPSLFFYLHLPWRGVTYLHSTFKKHTLSLAGFSQGFNCAFFFFPLLSLSAGLQPSPESLLLAESTVFFLLPALPLEGEVECGRKASASVTGE